ncbi:MAG: beta-ketoacyl synthase chain length factor [Rubrivivax sp.]
MIEAALAGIGLVGPGFTDWTRAAPLLRAPQLWSPTPTVVPAPTRLPANERRRAGPVVKAALAVADEAVAMAGAEAAALATVFTSSTGDPLNCHQLCEALATSERLVSPTRFTNSVHNAAAGCWHIATHSQAPSTSLAAFDASFGAGLLEAAVQCAHTGRSVLFVAVDVPYPEPLHALRPLADSFALAFVLAPARQPGLARLRIGTTTESETCCLHDALEPLRRQIPAARALPLLERLAAGPGGSAGRIVVAGADDWRLAVAIEPT